MESPSLLSVSEDDVCGRTLPAASAGRVPVHASVAWPAEVHRGPVVSLGQSGSSSGLHSISFTRGGAVPLEEAKQAELSQVPAGVILEVGDQLVQICKRGVQLQIEVGIVYQASRGALTPLDTGEYLIQ